MNDKDPILFYGPKWYCFSNFSAFQINWPERFKLIRGEDNEEWRTRDIRFMTSEHCYQWHKFPAYPFIQKEIIAARSAHDAFKLARSVDGLKVHNWHDIKVGVMREIIGVKLTQHPFVEKRLLETEDREIIEDSPSDEFWGWGFNRTGQNWLGKIWMEHRTRIQCNRKAAELPF